MRVQDFLAYCKPFYSRWDDDFCGRMLKQFALPLDTKIKHLSRGMKGKLALLSSLAYHPNLLVLDEPFSGLDPIVRQEFVEGIMEIFEQEDWSIFISSHDIEEVERLADYVGLLINGELKLVESVSSLQERFRRIEGNFAQPEVKLVTLPDRWIQLQQVDHAFRFIETGYQSMETEREVYRLFPDVKGLSVTPMSLREIFIALGRRYQLLN
jgi:ABC-2 type transport system ATP-binding protein